MTGRDLDFLHRYHPGTQDLTILALHGTGGDEDDLVPLARTLAPGANILSPRGRVRENGMPRFFRRLAEGVFDEEDLRIQTHALADFVEEARRRYGFDATRVVALGFSNGANIAGALLFLRPEVLAHAALLRPMTPLVPESSPDLSGRRIFLASGRLDPLIPMENPERLARMFLESGADVTHEWVSASHGLVDGDLRSAGIWFGRLLRELRID
jgi:phospholipase/carboxylesterase